NAAVVGHVVQAFSAVSRRADGADLLARRVLALLARHGLKESFGIVERLVIRRGIAGFRIGFVIAVDANPVHLAAAHHLIFADHGNVVFRLASDDAGVASITTVQVDRHRPAVLHSVVGILFFLIKG